MWGRESFREVEVDTWVLGEPCSVGPGVTYGCCVLGVSVSHCVIVSCDVCWRLCVLKLPRVKMYLYDDSPIFSRGCRNYVEF